MGPDWLNHINLDWPRLNDVQAASACQQILDKHDSIFKDELGTIKESQLSSILTLMPNLSFLKHALYFIYTLQAKVKNELNRLQTAGVIKPEWAAPNVPVVKPDGLIRIRGDHKITINQSAKLNNIPNQK